MLIPSASPESGDVSVTVVSDSDAVTQQLADVANHVAEACACSIETARSDSETCSTAHQSGMSVGKYRLCCELSEMDRSLTFDDCGEMDASQVSNRIHEHEDEDAHHDESESSASLPSDTPTSSPTPSETPAATDALQTFTFTTDIPTAMPTEITNQVYDDCEDESSSSHHDDGEHSSHHEDSCHD